MTQQASTKVFSLYMQAVAYICAGNDCAFEATALDWQTPGHAMRITDAYHVVYCGYRHTYAQGTAYFAEVAKHRAAGGDILYIEIGCGPAHLGTVAAWLDSKGETVKYEAVALHHIESATAPGYATFGAAIDAVCSDMGEGDNTGPFEIDNQPGIPWQAFRVCGEDWTVYIALDYESGKWMISPHMFTRERLHRPA